MNAPAFGHEVVYHRLSHMWRWRDDRIVVYSDAHFNLSRIELNEVGSQVWEMLDGQRRIRDVINILAERYPDASSDEIFEGISDFIEDMHEEWLVMSQEELNAYD